MKRSVRVRVVAAELRERSPVILKWHRTSSQGGGKGVERGAFQNEEMKGQDIGFLRAVQAIALKGMRLGWWAILEGLG